MLNECHSKKPGDCIISAHLDAEGRLLFCRFCIVIRNSQHTLHKKVKDIICFVNIFLCSVHVFMPGEITLTTDICAD